MGASNFRTITHGDLVQNDLGQLVVLGRGSLHALDTGCVPYKTSIAADWQEVSGHLVNSIGCVLVDFDLESMPQQVHSLVHGWNRFTVIGCSENESSANVSYAVKAGCHSFLSKSSSAKVLLQAIDEAIKADQFGDLSPSKMRQQAAKLTSREREVLTLFLEGSNTKMIAHQLDVSYQTIDKHRNRGLRKLEASSLVALARRFPLPKSIAR